MKNVSRSQTTSCYKCGSLIRWSDNISEDDEYVGVIDKLRQHWKNDVACNRGEKLKEIFGESNEKNAQMFWEEIKVS